MPPERVADCRRVKPAQRPQIKETFWKTCAIGQSALKQAANALLSESQGPSARDETWKGARLTEDSVGKVCTLEAISYGLASAGIQSIYPAQLGWQHLLRAHAAYARGISSSPSTVKDPSPLHHYLCLTNRLLTYTVVTN